MILEKSVFVTVEYLIYKCLNIRLIPWRDSFNCNSAGSLILARESFKAYKSSWISTWPEAQWCAGLAATVSSRFSGIQSKRGPVCEEHALQVLSATFNSKVSSLCVNFKNLHRNLTGFIFHMTVQSYKKGCRKTTVLPIE